MASEPDWQCARCEEDSCTPSWDSALKLTGLAHSADEQHLCCSCLVELQEQQSLDSD